VSDWFRGCQTDCVNGNNQLTLLRERIDDAAYTRTLNHIVVTIFVVLQLPPYLSPLAPAPEDAGRRDRPGPLRLSAEIAGAKIIPD
jgi:hypothetical protein